MSTISQGLEGGGERLHYGRHIDAQISSHRGESIDKRIDGEESQTKEDSLQKRSHS